MFGLKNLKKTNTKKELDVFDVIGLLKKPI